MAMFLNIINKFLIFFSRPWTFLEPIFVRAWWLSHGWEALQNVFVLKFWSKAWSWLVGCINRQRKKQAKKKWTSQWDLVPPCWGTCLVLKKIIRLMTLFSTFNCKSKFNLVSLFHQYNVINMPFSVAYLKTVHFYISTIRLWGLDFSIAELSPNENQIGGFEFFFLKKWIRGQTSHVLSDNPLERKMKDSWK